MKDSSTVSLGCQIIAEFDDDAGGVAGTQTVATDAYPFTPPTAEAAAAAKNFWLHVLGRFTEQVPGKEGHVRVRDVAAPNCGRIVVEYGRGGDRRTRHGSELDHADNLCLALFQVEHCCDGAAADKESVIPIPWTETVNIHFEILRPPS